MAAQGQIIVLAGVTSAAPPTAPRIDMNSVDLAAVKIGSLKHVVSARALTGLPAGGVSGRCRASGAPLISKGTAAALLLTTVGGRPALWLGAAGNASAALALPPGSFTESFTAVMTVSVGALSLAATFPTNFLAGFDGEIWSAQVLRHYGSPVSSSQDVFATRGNDEVGPYVEKARVPGNWNIVVVDYNNDTRVASIAVNSVATLSAMTLPAGRVPAPTEYFEIGYHLSNSGLRDSKVGDLYTFSDSLLRTDFGKTQLTELVASLKTYYAIA
jgi:hypothetical protein